MGPAEGAIDCGAPMPTNGNPVSANGAPDEKIVEMGAAVAGNDPTGMGLVLAFSNMTGSCGPSSMDGDRGPMRSD